WAAMQQAEIGWPQRGDDRSVNELESYAAELTGLEAGLFVFTASTANLLAMMVATQRGDQVILEADAHQVWIEGWNLAYVCGVYPRLLPSETGARIRSARERGLKWLGASGMHRGGLWAAAGLHALRTMVDRLADDHRRARALADAIREVPGIAVNQPETNQVRVSTAAAVPA